MNWKVVRLCKTKTKGILNMISKSKTIYNKPTITKIIGNLDLLAPTASNPPNYK